MNSRRLTDWPLKQRVLPYHAVGCIVHHGKFWPPMSALGQKQTLEHVRVMSALPPKADMVEPGRDIRFGAKSGHWRGYSITSSAVAWSDDETLRLRALAVFILMTS